MTYEMRIDREEKEILLGSLGKRMRQISAAALECLRDNDFKSARKHVDEGEKVQLLFERIASQMSAQDLEADRLREIGPAGEVGE